MSPIQHIEDKVISGRRLRGRAVFLSASFPDMHREPRFFESADPHEITQAVLATTRAVLSTGGILVFGGHPTISPLVLMVAEEYLPKSLMERERLSSQNLLPVKVYQSKFFKEDIPEATQKLFNWRLAELIWTESVANDRAKSLEKMRSIMLDESKPVAAIFIGGMEGIRDEAELFKRIYPTRQVYMIGGPGGAARELVSEYRSELLLASGLTWDEIELTHSYPSLMQRIVLDIEARL